FLDNTKLHFVLIDFVDDQYQIQARQYDGTTGLASRVVRRDRTADREYVSRLVLSLVDRDFGLVGTVGSKEAGGRVRVDLKAGGMGGELGRWVKKGEVFAVAEISRIGTGLRSRREDWMLLRVEEEPRDGACVCRLFHRFGKPLVGGPSVLGYRCLKLGTS